MKLLFFLLLFVLFCLFRLVRHVEWKELPEDEKRRRKAARKRYRKIESEAWDRYPNVLHWPEREEYIRRRLRGENPD